MYKYLYGKWKYLKPLVDGSGQIRLCDIRHYARLENENMQDDEEVKYFEFTPESIRIAFAGIEVNPDSLVGNVKFSMPVRNCLCICFSNKKNDPELFDKFDADVCIEFNVEYLVNFLKFVFEDKFGGKVVARNVEYYDKNAGLDYLPSEAAVFTKPIKYIHESEYRIAAFLPYDAETLINLPGKEPFRAFQRCDCPEQVINTGGCCCYFAFLDNGLKDGFKSYIGEIEKLTSGSSGTANA
ncbi:TPA: hypothetical protein ACGUMO_004576 [Vibrio vulnificus]|uniref:hypothetical protein n=1 Tax=Vibrio vulnificus TaxID=672 RepID=UPI0032421BE4|nr:hypothetical protein [Vibrio vulnificus]